MICIHRKRLALSGIVSALIMFVMLFTVGTGYFLWVFTNDQIYSQALVGRNNANQAQQAEVVSLCPGTYGITGSCIPGLMKSGDIQVTAINKGGGPITLYSILVIDSSNRLVSTKSISPVVALNPAGNSTQDTGFAYPGGGVFAIKVLTQRGNTFVTSYPQGSANSNVGVTTFLSATTIPTGTSAYDSAFLFGITSNAGGTVTYYYSTTNTCPATSPTTVGSVVVSNGAVPNSPAVTFGSPGVYYWYAAYSGDFNNAAAISPCETLVVTPSVTTSLSSPIISAGQPAYDTATLTGVTSNAGGTVTYYFSGINSCPVSGATTIGQVTVTNGKVPNSTSVQFKLAGVYYLYATYSGDTNNLGATSQCEQLVVQGSNQQTQVPFAIALSYFRFYYGTGSTYSFGDGYPVGGYFAYVPPGGGSSGVYQFKITNVDVDGRDIVINDKSFVYEQPIIGTGNPHSPDLYIVGDIKDSFPYQSGVTVLPFSTSENTLNGFRIPFGQTALLNFSAKSPEGTDLTGTLSGGAHDALFPFISGSYGDGTPFSLTVGYTGIFGSNSNTAQCTEAPLQAYSCSGAAGNIVTLTTSAFSVVPNAYWLNADGTTSVLTCNGTCTTATFSFKIPNSAKAGNHNMVILSDNVNDAYATVNVLSQTSLGVSCNPTTFAPGATSQCTAILSGFSGSVTGETITWSQSGTGSVTFPSGNTCTLSSGGTCSVTIKGSTLGAVNIQSSYSGDAGNGAASGTTSVTVKATTTTSVTCATNPVKVGASTTCTGTISGSVGSIVGDTITFSSNGAGTFSPSVTCTIAAGTSCSVAYTPSAVGTGMHTITATFNGDSNNAVSSGSTPLTVSKATPTTTVLCGAISGSGASRQVTCTATVTGPSGGPTPTGTVSWSSGGAGGTFSNPGSTCTLPSGSGNSASCSVTWTVPSGSFTGTVTFTANYAGDANYVMSPGTRMVTF